jgi:DNA-binding transcriptional MerR regulator
MRPSTASTLRYYDELGLVGPAARAAGRRRYAASAVRDVGVILFFREIEFSLAEIGRFISGERQCQREMIDHKLAELAEQQHRIEVARTALEHGRQCPASEPMKCSRFWSIIEGRLRGLSLEESHARAHAGGEHEPVPGPFREVVTEQLRDREDGTGHPRRVGHRRDLGRGLRRLLAARDPQDHLAAPGSQQPRRAAVAQPAQDRDLGVQDRRHPVKYLCIRISHDTDPSGITSVQPDAAQRPSVLTILSHAGAPGMSSPRND